MVHNFLAVILASISMIALAIASFYISIETYYKICGVIVVLGIISLISIYAIDWMLNGKDYAEERKEKRRKKKHEKE